MTVPEFLTELEGAYPGRSLTPRQTELYHRKLCHFDGKDLDLIFEELIETGRTFPRIADVYAAAHTLNLKRPGELPIHTWLPGSCAVSCAETTLREQA